MRAETIRNGQPENQYCAPGNDMLPNVALPARLCFPAVPEPRHRNVLERVLGSSFTAKLWFQRGKIWVKSHNCDLNHNLWQAYRLFWARCGTAAKPRDRFVNPIGKGGHTAARDRCLPESEMATSRSSDCFRLADIRTEEARGLYIGVLCESTGSVPFSDGRTERTPTIFRITRMFRTRSSFAWQFSFFGVPSAVGQGHAGWTAKRFATFQRPPA